MNNLSESSLSPAVRLAKLQNLPAARYDFMVRTCFIGLINGIVTERFFFTHLSFPKKRESYISSGCH